MASCGGPFLPFLQAQPHAQNHAPLLALAVPPTLGSGPRAPDIVHYTFDNADATNSATGSVPDGIVGAGVSFAGNCCWSSAGVAQRGLKEWESARAFLRRSPGGDRPRWERG